MEDNNMKEEMESMPSSLETKAKDEETRSTNGRKKLPSWVIKACALFQKGWKRVKAPFAHSDIGVGMIPVPEESELSDTNEGDFHYTAKEKVESIKKINAEREKKFKIRALFDVLRSSITYILSCLSLLVLIGIIVYCFSTGWDTFSWDFVTGNYNSINYNVRTPDDFSLDPNTTFQEPHLDEGEYFSQRWGIVFADSFKTDGTEDVIVTYVDANSPISKVHDLSEQPFHLANGYSVTMIIGKDENGASVTAVSRNGAEAVAENLDRMVSISSGFFASGGFGIRGPLVATLYMILFSLIIALPLGIGGAVYLSYYAKKGTITKLIQSLIDMISGIPSIIFGLAGAILFIPIFNWTGATGNILSGSATLACIVLPTIMKATQEAINAIPKSLKNASLALGASQTQTVFRIIIPNSVPGILTGTLLAIGRIIGESAALVFATGTFISDTPSPTNTAASLAVYIWKIMSGEAPNYKAAAAAAILILLVVLILNIAVKLIAAKLDKFRPVGPKPWYRKLYEKTKKKYLARKEVRASIMGKDRPAIEGGQEK